MLKNERSEKIEAILKDLKDLKKRKPPLNQVYGVDEAIRFFEAAESRFTYLGWLLGRASKLDRERLLELGDFPLSHWEDEIQEKLIQWERRKFPLGVTPLAERLFELASAKGGRFIGMSLGCGGMETERQLIQRMIKLDSSRAYPIVIIGIDRSPAAHEVAKKNLSELGDIVAIREVDDITEPLLNDFMQAEQSRHLLILAKNDIFNLPQRFKPRAADVIYHTFFRHHLDDLKGEAIDTAIGPLGKKILEYDGYQSQPFSFGFRMFGAWQTPALLNKLVFSNLRERTKKRIDERLSAGVK